MTYIFRLNYPQKIFVAKTNELIPTEMRDITKVGFALANIRFKTRFRGLKSVKLAVNLKK